MVTKTSAAYVAISGKPLKVAESAILATLAWCTDCGDVIKEGDTHARLMALARRHTKAEGHNICVSVTREITIGRKHL